MSTDNSVSVGGKIDNGIGTASPCPSSVPVDSTTIDSCSTSKRSAKYDDETAVEASRYFLVAMSCTVNDSAPPGHDSDTRIMAESTDNYT